jgi:hypothetical protein
LNANSLKNKFKGLLVGSIMLQTENIETNDQMAVEDKILKACLDGRSTAAQQGHPVASPLDGASRPQRFFVQFQR